MPLVSVIMSSYQYDRYIAEAIDSVLNQTIRDLELIIVDDGSTDRSHQIIQSYTEKDSRVTPIFNGVNMGIARTMNTGIDAAEGKFIAFISSDDIWFPRKLEFQLKVLKNDEDLVVWTEGVIIDVQGKPTGETFTQIHGSESRIKSGDIFNELLKGNFIFGSSRILKRSNLDGIRWNENLKYLNDYQFAVDLARKYRFYFIPEPLTMYRIHGKNTVTRDLSGFLIDNILLGRYFLSQYGDVMENQSRLWIYDRSIDSLRDLMDNSNPNREQLDVALKKIRRHKSSISFKILKRFHCSIAIPLLPPGTKRRRLYDNLLLKMLRRF
jgi:glycosyltransferase involved in cell wall biosynthesis